MAVANVIRPQVVKLGGAYEERYAYLDAATIVQGDLIRINAAGTISVAKASLPGAVHGMALEDGTVAGDSLPVLMFADDTIVKLSAIDAVVPTTSLIKGSEYTLEIGTNEFGVTATETSGIALIVDYPDTGNPWGARADDAFVEDSSVAGGNVNVRFSAATLAGTVAA